jgi:hypothetical protein
MALVVAELDTGAWSKPVQQRCNNPEIYKKQKSRLQIFFSKNNHVW